MDFKENYIHHLIFIYAILILITSWSGDDICIEIKPKQDFFREIITLYKLTN